MPDKLSGYPVVTFGIRMGQISSYLQMSGWDFVWGTRQPISPIFRQELTTMVDHGEIVRYALEQYFIVENSGLYRVIDNLNIEIRRLKRQVSRLSRTCSRRNQVIAELENRLVFLNSDFEQRLRMQRILVNVDNALYVFQRNADNVFEQVPEDPDETESETEFDPPAEEEALETARRLGFEDDSDGYISDDLMRSLLTDE